jgi:non-heme chloroperoxidase
MGSITTADGTEIYYKDWGSGQPVVFSHGWPLTADAWEDQMLHLASNGCRAIAHDRRDHGRSSQPWHGNEMDTHADDLPCSRRSICAAWFSSAHSTGGEVARAVSGATARRESPRSC